MLIQVEARVLGMQSDYCIIIVPQFVNWLFI